MAAVKCAFSVPNMPTSPPSSPSQDLANDWENRAIAAHFGPNSSPSAARDAVLRGRSTTFDSVICPGLYSASGFDVMGILLWTMTRPNPMVEIGPIDCSVPMVLCDLTKPDQPLVYVSDSFLEMTGYTKAEVLGRNCRFLQTHGNTAKPLPSTSPRRLGEKTAAARMRDAVERNAEIQLPIDNYKRDGTKFTNFVTMIPVAWNSPKYNLSLGLLCDVDA